MKVAKTLSIIIAIVVALFIAAVVFLYSNLDSLVETAIEKAGTEVTQTRVEVGGVKLELASGEGTISGLQVDSPAGFSRQQIFTLGQVTVGVDPNTITEDVVVINKVLIKAPQIYYEINDKGDSNLDELKQNIQKLTAGKQKSSEPGKDVKLVIRKLVIEGAELDARVAALGDKDLSANIPTITLNNIGEESGGASAAEVAEKVSRVLIEKATTAVAEMGVQQYVGKSVEEAKAQLEQKAKDALKDKMGDGVTDELGDKLKGLF